MLKQLICILLILVATNTFATHNRAGEITYTHISGFTYEITIIIYTKASSPSDRPWLEMRLCGVLDSIQRDSKTLIAPDINKNVYIKQHIFPGASPLTCIISVEDPNRTADIVNIPNSVNTIFYLETELNISPFFTGNNSPLFLIDAVDSACLNNLYSYNAGATDVDGDSLYYSLNPCLKEGSQLIINYQFPQASSSFIIDNYTGTVTWDTPTFIGLYNFDVLVEEYRNGFKIGSVLREIQIDVKPTCSVGVYELIDNKLNLAVYPNPFNNKLTVNYELINTTATLEIYNLLGKKIKSQLLSQSTTVIDLANFSNGIYFITIVDGNSRISRKVVKH